MLVSRMLLLVGTKIYMHGGNTTQTVSTDSYAKDLWVLDTQTWQWTSAPESMSGRASHTLIRSQDNLLTLSGFEFETSKTKAAQNALVMVYDLNTLTWGTQFGTLNKTFFQQHGIAIIGSVVAGFIILLVIASITARLWRKYTRGPLSPKTAAGGSISRGRPNIKGSITSKRRSKANLVVSQRPSDQSPSAAAASRLSDTTVTNEHGHYETKIDLSTMPRASEHQYQYPQQQSFNPYASTRKQQQVPLMSANVLEQQSQDFGTYKDEDDLEEKDMRPARHLPYAGGSGSRSGSFSHVGQPVAGLPYVPRHGAMTPGTMTPESRNPSPPRG